MSGNERGAVKRRARRIAADEAHAWARNLRLRNTVAKFILCDLTQYVDGDGFCFVSIPAIAEDTELSTSTVRNKLAWLENVGVIARTAQWIDEYGHRSGNGRGRRTSDLIRLMVDLDEFGIEERAGSARETGARNDDDSEADPVNVTVAGLEGQTTLPSNLPSGRPSALPSDSVQGLISEPESEREPEFTPKPPPGAGAPQIDSESEATKEPEHFAEFWRAYPGHEAMVRSRSLELFRAMTEAERLHARAAASVHATTLKSLDRRPRDAHKWLAEKGWLEYPQAKLQPITAAPTKRLIRGNELKAALAGLRMAALPPPTTIDTRDEETGRSTMSVFWSRPIGPDLLALAEFADSAGAGWLRVDVGSPGFAAWRDRFKEWFGREPAGERIWLEEFDPAVHSLNGSDPNFKPRKQVYGFRVPHQFPPRRDGSWSPKTDDSSEVA